MARQLHLPKNNQSISQGQFAEIFAQIEVLKDLHLNSAAFVQDHGLDPAIFLPGNIWSDISRLDRFTEWTFDMVNMVRIASPFSGFHLAAWARQDDPGQFSPDRASEFYSAFFSGTLGVTGVEEAAERLFGLSTRMQGAVDHLIGQWDGLVAQTPGRYRLRAPMIGGEIGVLHDGHILNPDILSHQSRMNALYAGGALEELERRVRDDGVADYLEIGSGHCAFAFALNACFDHKLRMHLVDLPTSLANACAYLGAAGRSHDMAIVTPDRKDAVVAHYVLIANYLVPAYESRLPAFDLVHNAISLNEMAQAQVDYYMRLVRAHLAPRGVFHLSEGQKSLDYHVDALEIGRGVFPNHTVERDHCIGAVPVIEAPNSYFRI
jgi:hypothetical protein